MSGGPCIQDTTQDPGPLGQLPYRNQLVITTTAELVIGRTMGPCTDVTVVLNGNSDAGAQGAAVKVYSVMQGIRTLEKTFNMPNPIDSLSHDFTWAGTGCDFFEVTFTAVAAMTASLIFCIQGFGEEDSVGTAGGAVTLAGDVTGPSNANTVSQISNGAGTVYAQPNATVAGLEIGSQAGANLGLVIGPMIGGPSTYVGFWTLGSAGVPAANNAALELAGGGDSILNGGMHFFGTIYPATDNVYNCGLNTNRWALVRGVVVTSGDLDLEDEKRDAHWTLREMPGWLLAMNRKTGERFKVPLVPLTPEEAEEAEESERASERYTTPPPDFDLSREGLDS